MNDDGIDNALNLIEQMLIEDLNVTISTNWENLKQSANNFLHVYNEFTTNEQFYTREQLMQTIDSENSFSSNKTSKQAFLNKGIYIAAFTFDKDLNIFLENLPKEVLYVYKSAKYFDTYSMSLIQLAKFTDAYFHLRPSRARLEKEQNTLQKQLENKIALTNDNHVKKVQAAYNGVTNRIQVYYDRFKPASKNNARLLWKNDLSQWVVARVLNQGDIKEAYAAALILEHDNKLKNLDIGQPPYYEHNLIRTFFIDYIAKVDNRPAIATEDIVTKQKMYGVKSVGASMPSIKQYLTIAEMIRDSQSKLSKEEIKKFIDTKFATEDGQGVRNKIIKIGSLEVENQIGDIIEGKEIKVEI